MTERHVSGISVGTMGVRSRGSHPTTAFFEPVLPEEPLLYEGFYTTPDQPFYKKGRKSTSRGSIPFHLSGAGGMIGMELPTFRW